MAADKKVMTDRSDTTSVAESFKHRSNSYFNPLLQRSEQMVVVPENKKSAISRLPPYQKQLDLIANGVSEFQTGVTRYPIRIGHTSKEEKS